MGTILIVAVLVGGIALLVTHGGSSDEAQRDAAATTTTTTEPVTTTAAPIPWTTFTDPRSGLTWKMPGTYANPSEDNVAFIAVGPKGLNPTTWNVGVLQGETGPLVQVAIWGPEGRAGQADIDRTLAFSGDVYRQLNTPYPKPLTLAGVPATAVDGSDRLKGAGSSWEAIAVVDGSFVMVRVSGREDGTADPEVFEQVMASFART